MNATRLRSAAFAVVVASIVATACTSGDTPPTADPATTVASTAPSTTSTTESSSTTTEPDEATAPLTWCEMADEVETASDAVDAIDFSDPVALERAMTDLVEVTRIALEVAPADLADDVQVTLDGMIAFRDELAAVDYEFLEADLGVLSDPDGTMRAASDRIEQYNFAECGIALDEDDDDPAFDPDEGTLHDQIVASLVASGLTVDEAECLFGEIDFADRSQTEDRELIAAAFDACGIDAGQIEP